MGSTVDRFPSSGRGPEVENIHVPADLLLHRTARKMHGGPALREMRVVNSVAIKRPARMGLDFRTGNMEQFEAAEENLPHVAFLGR